MNDYNYKLNNYLLPLLQGIKNPNILELGVKNGISTQKFLNLCKNNNGKLFSVDVVDCSNVSNDENWKFIQSRDDNFKVIKSIIPEKLDVIFIDTIHEAKHVEKIIYGYFDMLEEGGYLFIDDISHLPYLKTSKNNNFYCEINNEETFKKIIEIYNSNINLMDLNFSFKSSGLAIIKKKNSLLIQPNIKIQTRKHSLKNIFRKLWLKLTKN